MSGKNKSSSLNETKLSSKDMKEPLYATLESDSSDSEAVVADFKLSKKTPVKKLNIFSPHFSSKKQHSKSGESSQKKESMALAASSSLSSTTTTTSSSAAVTAAAIAAATAAAFINTVSATTTATTTPTTTSSSLSSSFFKSRPKKLTIEDLSPIFGVEIELSIKRFKCHDGVPIPYPVRLAIDAVEEDGLYTEYVYKKTDSKSKTNALKKKLNRRQIVYIEDHKVITFTSVLRLFFKELPENIFTSQFLPSFEHIVAKKDSSTMSQGSATDKNANGDGTKSPEETERIKQMIFLLNELPKCNRITISWLILHLMNVLFYEKDNKMNIRQISSVFSQIFKVSEHLVKFLLTNSAELFVNISIFRYAQPVLLSAHQEERAWEYRGDIMTELAKQESLLDEIHSEMNEGFLIREHILWEVQRFITQLKRKLKKVEERKKPKLSEADMKLEFERTINRIPTEFDTDDEIVQITSNNNINRHDWANSREIGNTEWPQLLVRQQPQSVQWSEMSRDTNSCWTVVEAAAAAAAATQVSGNDMKICCCCYECTNFANSFDRMQNLTNNGNINHNRYNKYESDYTNVYFNDNFGDSFQLSASSLLSSNNNNNNNNINNNNNNSYYYYFCNNNSTGSGPSTVTTCCPHTATTVITTCTTATNTDTNIFFSDQLQLMQITDRNEIRKLLFISKYQSLAMKKFERNLMKTISAERRKIEELHREIDAVETRNHLKSSFLTKKCNESTTTTTTAPNDNNVDVNNGGEVLDNNDGDDDDSDNGDDDVLTKFLTSNNYFGNFLNNS